MPYPMNTRVPSPLLPFLVVLVIVAAYMLTAWSRNSSSKYAGRSAFSALQITSSFKGSASNGKPSCGACSDTKFIPPVKTRNDIAGILQAENFSIGAELGVQRGLFSVQTLNVWTSCKKYYLVDLWAPQENYKDVANVGLEEQNKYMTEAHTRLQRFDSKLVWLRNYTTAAAQQIKEPLDYVYVDARHDYCGVLEDIKLYWPLLRPGGIMAGHDYADAPEIRPSGQDWSICADGSKNEGAVKGAVNEFFTEQGVQIVVTYREGAWNSWLARKPLCC